MIVAKTIIIYVIVGLAALVSALYLVVIIVHSNRFFSERRDKKLRAHIDPLLEEIKNNGNQDAYNALYDYFKKGSGKLEDLLLDFLSEKAEDDFQHQRLMVVAQHYDFPQKALRLFNSRRIQRLALACRKAGIYRNPQGKENVLKTLRESSSLIQYQAMMALSLIGDVEYFAKGIAQIEHHIMLNERTLFEIINMFNGNKEELFRRMIRDDVDYVAMIFLKALDTEAAKTLELDVINQLSSKEMERVIAAIKASAVIEKEYVCFRLLSFLDDPRWQVRSVTAKSLGNYCQVVGNNHNVIQELKKALSDPNWWVRVNAAQTIIKYPNTRDVIEEIMSGDDKYAKECLEHIMLKNEQQGQLKEEEKVRGEL